jgi:Ferredoxin-like domain in Api92-like protein
MPNWCSNSMTIQGPNADLDSFHEAMKHEGDFRLLEAFVPASEYHRTHEGYNNGGYEWCIANWGTKWPEGEMQVDFDPEAIGLSFETAWAPPLAGIEKIATMFPTLVFFIEWSEPGMGFCGAAIYRDRHSVLVEDEVSFDGIDIEDWMAQQGVLDETREACAEKVWSQIGEVV